MKDLVYSYEELVVNANARSVFCSSAWALADPVAGLALADRLIVRTERPLPNRRRNRGVT